jgi:epoxyqueuosine reductase
MDVLQAFKEIEERTSATIGVTDTAAFPEEEARLAERVEDGLHGGLSFTYANPGIASHPAVSFPWASSIVVAAVPYLMDGDGDVGGRTVARFAEGDRYVHVREVLAEIAAVLTSDGSRMEVVFDDNRLIDRALALRAGVAWSGKSTMVLTPGAGPWILLGSVVTDAELVSTTPMRRTCGTCDACIPACPTGAIVAPGVLDARRCISAVLQRRGIIDRALRRSIGGRIYGCDECLTACPPGRPALAARTVAIDRLRPELILTLSDEELEPIVEHWYVPSRRMRFVRRNALVALGNVGDEASLGLLSKYLGSQDELLAIHAAWAVGEIGGFRAKSILKSLLKSETREAVVDELRYSVTVCSRDVVYADALSVAPPHDTKESPL